MTIATPKLHGRRWNARGKSSARVATFLLAAVIGAHDGVMANAEATQSYLRDEQRKLPDAGISGAAAPNSGLRKSAAERVQHDFEAMMLQTLLAQMMARQQKGLLGSGPAGRHWQAMLTEHLARHLAASNQLRLWPGRRDFTNADGPATASRLSYPSRLTASATDNQSASWQTTISSRSPGRPERDGWLVSVNPREP